MTVQAIPTRYAGCHFRSRLEARWAVFFDALGIRWQYEPQGFEIVYGDETRRYLPDFHLPDLEVWVEVKGDDARIDWALLGVACDGFADAGLPQSGRSCGGGESQGSAVLVLGDIPPDGPNMWLHPLITNQKGVYCHWHFWGPGTLNDAAWIREAGYFDAGWNGFAGEWMWGLFNDQRPSVHGTKERSGYQRLNATRAAYTAARSARFEHGQSGA